ncbi:MAG: hypothetical protein Ct9H90mP7_4050 [Candidatus Neomarinimicrobiota bacterium]|nr:MAG: hypothetical protein Ct9H90mP7_4050 [Candidatus Neomarinimicrobiota bacterium]
MKLGNFDKRPQKSLQGIGTMKRLQKNHLLMAGSKLESRQMDDEGFIYIVDRQKDMYISGGENVYPAEVENVIYQLPEIAEAAIIGVPDKKWGETGKAFIVFKNPIVIYRKKISSITALKILQKF